MKKTIVKITEKPEGLVYEFQVALHIAFAELVIYSRTAKPEEKEGLTIIATGLMIALESKGMSDGDLENTAKCLRKAIGTDAPLWIKTK
jgi:hypothetical protein